MADSDRPSNGAPLAMATRLAQAGHFIDPATGAIVPPVQPSTTFGRDASYALIGGFSYARDHNPTDAPAERLIAELEGGAEARLFASGLAAATAVFETLSAGQHVAAPAVMYHGLQAWLRRCAAQRGVAVTFYDATDLAALERAVEPGRTAIVWVESLLNPTWDVIDIAGTARIAHAAGAVLGVDATATPPVTLRALDLGADIVFHSATKYLNGHSDVTAGVLITRAADARWAEIKTVRTLAGGVLGPFDSWLLLRGMRTLALRFDRASENALCLARHFADHPAVERVLYPGLETHPGHEVARRQMHGGFGGMMSICVRGGAAEAKRVAGAVRTMVPATSLGGVETLIEHRATVQGPDSPVAPNLLRISVGIEAAEDLIADLEQALSTILA